MGKNVIISTLPNISQNYLPKVNTSNIFANSLVYDNGTNVMVNTTATHADYTNARLVVNNTGNTYLEVRGDGGQGTIALTTSTSTTSNFPTVEIFNSADFGIVGYRPGVVSSNYIMYYELSSSTNRRLTFQTEGVTRLAINQDGTSVFSSSVTASGNLNLQGAVTRNINFYDSSNTNINAQIQYDQISANSGQLFFKTNNAGTLSTRLTISNTGAATFSSSVTANGNFITSNSNVVLGVGNTSNNESIVFSYNSNASSRSWRILKDWTAFGDFQIQQSTTQTGSTYTPRLVIDPSGNVGIGVTPSAWMANSAALQVIRGGLWHDGSGYISMFNNAYYDGTNWRYISSTTATNYAQVNGTHQWFYAASGTAGNIVTFNEAMRITSGGNALIGTTDNTAAYRLNVAVNGGSAYMGVTNQAGGSGDRYLRIGFGTGATVASIQGTRVNVADDVNLALQPDGGNVGIGTTPSYKLDVSLPSGSNGQIIRINRSAGAYGYGIGIDSSSTFGIYDNGGSVRLGITSGGQIFLYNLSASAGTNAARYSTATGQLTYDTSSARYKNNIRDSVYGLSDVMKLKSRMFEYKEDNRTDVGLIAEEVISHIPELVGLDKSGQADSISYDRFVSVLVKAIQEQTEIINNLESRIKTLEAN